MESNAAFEYSQQAMTSPNRLKNMRLASGGLVGIEIRPVGEDNENHITRADGMIIVSVNAASTDVREIFWDRTTELDRVQHNWKDALQE